MAADLSTETLAMLLDRHDKNDNAAYLAASTANGGSDDKLALAHWRTRDLYAHAAACVRWASKALAVLRNIATNYDHEEQTRDHTEGYGGTCRKCEAERVLAAYAAATGGRDA